MFKSFQAKLRYALWVFSFPALAGLCVAMLYAVAIGLMEGSLVTCSRLSGPGILYNCYVLISPAPLFQSLAAGLVASIVVCFLMKSCVDRAKAFMDESFQQD